MYKNNKFTLKSRLESIKNASAGLGYMVKHESNAKIHTIATVLVVIAGFVRHIHTIQWISLLFAVALVWITEALNTSIELLCDYACNNEWQPQIKIIKDIAAASVWVAAIISVVIGVLVFLF